MWVRSVDLGYNLRRNPQAVALIVIGALLIGFSLRQIWLGFGSKKAVLIAGKKVTATVVSNQASRAQGLSGTSSLCQDCGMLFLFPKSDFYSFWMKGMRFDIDIIWISEKRVVGVTPNVPYPLEEAASLPSYYPPAAINAALEVNAGWAQGNGIKVGDEVKY